MNSTYPTLDEVACRNSYWSNMIKEHGRETAELELMFELACIEGRKRRRAEDQVERERNKVIWTELDAYLLKRKTFVGTAKSLFAADEKFLNALTSKGHNIYAWLDEFGTTVSGTLHKLQQMDIDWETSRSWERAKHLRQNALRIERLEEHKARAQITAEAVGAEAAKIIQSLIAAGVLTYGK